LLCHKTKIIYSIEEKMTFTGLKFKLSSKGVP
jgi:hypothetical protein